MNIKTYVIHRHVKGQDLNHHGTLFAGRGAEWFEYSRHGFLKGCSGRAYPPV